MASLEEVQSLTEADLTAELIAFGATPAATREEQEQQLLALYAEPVEAEPIATEEVAADPAAAAPVAEAPAPAAPAASTSAEDAAMEERRKQRLERFNAPPAEHVDKRLLKRQAKAGGAVTKQAAPAAAKISSDPEAIKKRQERFGAVVADAAKAQAVEAPVDPAVAAARAARANRFGAATPETASDVREMISLLFVLNSIQPKKEARAARFNAAPTSA